MGHWGVGLYSGDFAQDLRLAVSAVSRLPFSPDELVQLLCDFEPGPAQDSGNPDHTTFWLVIADQFARRGLISSRAREMAAAILESEADLVRLEQLGMKPADLARRRNLLADLKVRLTQTAAIRSRPMLKKPQPMLMERGDVLLFPTCQGRSINPYFASKELDRVYTGSGPQSWRQDGWSALCIADCGRAFDFLAWYRPLVLDRALRSKPDLNDLLAGLVWKLQPPGTCPAHHFRKVELAKLGRLSVDPVRLERQFGKLRPGVSAAVGDISLANSLKSEPASDKPAAPVAAERGTSPRVLDIRTLLSS